MLFYPAGAAAGYCFLLVSSFFLSFFKLGVLPNLFLSYGFFPPPLSSSHNLFLLPHAWSDFDQTWSEWPVGKWLQKLSTAWPQRSCRGHRGQKGHFDIKSFNSPILCSRITWLMHINQLCILYKSNQLHVNQRSFGVTGVKKRGQMTNNFKWRK